MRARGDDWHERLVDEMRLRGWPMTLVSVRYTRRHTTKTYAFATSTPAFELPRTGSISTN